MKHILLFVLVLAIVVCLIILGYRHYCIYGFSLIEYRYYEKTGMGAPYHNLEQIKQVKKGKYEEYMDDLGRNILRYEGYEYISDHYPYLDIVIITDQKYKISLFRVGIGSSKKNVQRVYRYCQKILDLPSNKIGFIDNGVWVEFSLDENECVTKIEFYRGP